MDFDELAKAIEEMREVLRAMVAGLVADGFTDEQARALVVSVMTGVNNE
jgi:uncharacterized membrane protein YebE (DUF533 family)